MDKVTGHVLSHRGFEYDLDWECVTNDLPGCDMCWPVEVWNMSQDESV
jgi:hypothetical protein